MSEILLSVYGKIVYFYKFYKFSSPESNFIRPIAILCFLSKVIEKLAHDQITAFLKNSNLLDPLQTGFRQFSSTETAFIKLTDDIRRGMENRLSSR